MNNLVNCPKIRMALSPAFLLLLCCSALLPIPRQLRAGETANRPRQKPVVSLSLRQFVDAVVAESPKILGSRLDEAAADDEARSAYASYLPHLTAEARVGYINGERLTGFALQEPGPGVVASQVIPNRSFTQVGPVLTIPVFKDGSFLGINIPPEVTRKRAERQVVKFRGSLTKHDLVFSATQAYLDAIKATHLLELRDEHLKVARKEAARVEERATKNLATAEELGVARLLVLTSRAAFEAERWDVIYSFLAVADLLGLDASKVRIEQSYPTPAPLPNFETFASLSSIEHPRVRLQEAIVDGAKAGVALRRSRQYPSLNAESFDYQYGDFHGHATNEWVSVMTASVPIFDFGEAASATRAATLTARAEKQRLLAVQQDVRKELLDALVQVRQSESASAKAAGDVAEQQRIATRLQEQAKTDQAVLADLYTAELKLLDSKEVFEQAQYDVFFQYAHVQKVSAGEWQWIKR
ncbi:MAG: TolC family protein [Chthoniobacterales bacterium]